MPTLADVAERAGVSHMTVSRYFNNPSVVRPATRERVRKAVEETGYVPNAVARSLANGRTKIVSLIVTDITNTFFTTLARGVEDEAQRHGYIITLGNTDENIDIERRYLSAMASRQVDGVIITPAPSAAHNLQLLTHRGIPAVLVDRELPSSPFDVVRGDTFEGARRLTRHLLDQGYRRIGFVGGPPEASSLKHRVAGYREVMDEAGMEPMVHLGDFTADSGKRIVRRLIDRDELPEALIAANNLVAVGVLSGLRNAGCSVPEDVALGCFEDLEFASRIDPFLTVVQQPSYRIGQVAMQLLLERMQSAYEGPPRKEILPTDLIIRRSTGMKASSS